MAAMHIIIPHTCKCKKKKKKSHKIPLCCWPGLKLKKIEACLVVVTWRKELTLVWIPSPAYSTHIIHSKSLTVLKIKCGEAGFFEVSVGLHTFYWPYAQELHPSLSYLCFCDMILWGLSHTKNRNICIALFLEWYINKIWNYCTDWTYHWKQER